MSRYSQIVEVNLHDFDDKAILEAAAQIRGRRTTSPLDDGPPTGREALLYLVTDLATAIASGDAMKALQALDDLAGDDRGMRDAIDIGSRRRR